MRLKAINLTTATQIFKCFSDESRIRILNLIKSFEMMCVSDLEQILDYTQAKTSRHVIYLKNNGLLTTEKHDQWTYYRIKDEFLETTERFLRPVQKDQQLQQDLKTFKTMYANNTLALRRLHNIQKKYILPEL